MFDIEAEFEEYRESRGDNLSIASQEIRDTSIRKFKNFCADIYEDDIEGVIEGLMKNHQAGYMVLKKFKKYELDHDNYISTIKLRTFFIRKHLEKYGIVLNDKAKLKEVFGKIPKHRREGVTHEEVEKLLSYCNHKLKTIILVQISSGMRISEVLSLTKTDVTKKERYEIKIRADKTKTKEERITFISKEAEPYLEVYLNGKEEKLFKYSRTGLATALQRALAKAGLDKRYDHTNQRLISSHSFRAFFISQMGKLEGFFGHSLSGHGHYMAQYDRYSPDELLEKYIEGEQYFQIFNRTNPAKLKRLEEKLKEQQREIDILKEIAQTQREESWITDDDGEEIKRNSPELKVTHPKKS